MDTYRFTKKLIESIGTETSIEKLHSMSRYCYMKSLEALLDENNKRKEELYDSRIALISKRYFELLNFKVGTNLKIKKVCTVDARMFHHSYRTITSINNDMSITVGKATENQKIVLDFGEESITEITTLFDETYCISIASVESVEPVPPKKELAPIDKIKNILIENITVEQAELYRYIAIDKNCAVYLYSEAPYATMCDREFNVTVGTFNYLPVTFKEKELEYIRDNWTSLCFKIEDLGGAI